MNRKSVPVNHRHHILKVEREDRKCLFLGYFLFYFIYNYYLCVCVFAFQLVNFDMNLKKNNKRYFNLISVEEYGVL